jgi:hypothetical protein
VEALLSTSPSRTVVLEERAEKTAQSAAPDPQSLFQSFTLQMERIDDLPAVVNTISTVVSEPPPTDSLPTGGIGQPLVQALSFDNLATFSVHLPTLPTLPPTPSSPHNEKSCPKIVTASETTALTEQSVFLSPGEDDGGSTAPPEQEVGQTSLPRLWAMCLHL